MKRFAAVVCIGLAIFLLAINWRRIGDSLHAYVYPSEEEIIKGITDRTSVLPFSYVHSDDIFVVVNVAPLGDTGINSVIAKRHRDGLYVSALYGGNIKKGDCVGMGIVRQPTNRNGDFVNVPVIRPVVKEEVRI